MLKTKQNALCKSGSQWSMVVGWQSTVDSPRKAIFLISVTGFWPVSGTLIFIAAPITINKYEIETE